MIIAHDAISILVTALTSTKCTLGLVVNLTVVDWGGYDFSIVPGLEEPPNFRKLRVHRVVTEGRWLRSNSSSKCFSCLFFLHGCGRCVGGCIGGERREVDAKYT